MKDIYLKNVNFPNQVRSLLRTWKRLNSYISVVIEPILLSIDIKLIHNNWVSIKNGNIIKEKLLY